MTESNEPLPSTAVPAAGTNADAVDAARAAGSSSATANAAPGSAAAGATPAAPTAGGETPKAAATAPKRAALIDRLPPLRGLGGVMLLGLVLIALLGWQWMDLRHKVSQTQEQLARRLVEGAAQLRDARTLAAGAQEALQAQAARIAVLESRLVELNAQQGALEGLYQELSRGRDEWLLSEVDQLVGLAGQQLQLAGNVQGAIAALSNAEARLARSERPQFAVLRKAVAKDLQKLRSLPLVDVAGLALRLETVALAADKMTLAFEARPQNPAPPAPSVISKARPNDKVREPMPGAWTTWWKRGVAEVWGEIHNLVRIERFDHLESAVLAPQHSIFLRENLKLRLLGARLALLGRDQATFKGELRQAEQWLEKYFDGRDRSVAGALDTLKPLLAAELSIEPPALNESQSALRAVKLSADRVVR